MKTRAYLPLALLGLALVALPVSAQQVNLGSNQSVALNLASLTKAACHGTVSCQPNYPSCASWSSYAGCDGAYCGTARCNCEYIEGHLFCYSDDAWKEPLERFRVCFDQYGNSCTEWQQIWTSTCGCP